MEISKLLHNKKFHNLYSSQNIIMVIQSWKMRSVEHEARER